MVSGRSEHGLLEMQNESLTAVHCTVMWEATHVYLIITVPAMGIMMDLEVADRGTCCISDFSYHLLQPVRKPGDGMAGGGSR